MILGRMGEGKPQADARVYTPRSKLLKFSSKDVQAESEGFHRRLSSEIGLRRRKLKQEKAKKRKLLCFLGKDVMFDMVLGISKRTLLGCFEYIRMSMPEIIAWMTACWKPLINYTPMVNILMNSWLSFHFLTEKSLQTIVERLWVIGKGSLVFFRWHAAFNP